MHIRDRRWLSIRLLHHQKGWEPSYENSQSLPWTEFLEELRLFTTMQVLPPLRSFIICDCFSKEMLLQRMAGIPTTEGCYTDAIDMLQKHFSDKTRQEQECFTRLLQPTPVDLSGDTGALWQLCYHYQDPRPRVIRCEKVVVFIDALQHHPWDITMRRRS